MARIGVPSVREYACLISREAGHVDHPEYAALRLVTGSGVARVTLDHPPLNLLDAVLMADLKDAVGRFRHDPDVRVVVFDSADEDFFCAHGDAHFVTQPETFAAVAVGVPESTNPMQALHESVRQLPQVTIGKIAGLARGGGHELLMAMDMRFAAIGKAAFAQPDTHLDIIPGGGGTQYLTRLIGRARAMEVVLGGALVDAELAERYGLVNRALPADELDEFVDTLAHRLAGLAPGVIEGATAAIDAALDGPLEDGLRVENARLNQLFTPAAAERTSHLLTLGFQTRDGERDLEHVLNRPRSSA